MSCSNTEQPQMGFISELVSKVNMNLKMGNLNILFDVLFKAKAEL